MNLLDGKRKLSEICWNLIGNIREITCRPENANTFWPETEIKWICWNLIGKIREITSRPENANKIMKNLTKTYVKSRHLIAVWLWMWRVS